MTSTLHLLGIEHDASHSIVAEHVYNHMRAKWPAGFPQAWSHAPEPLRLAMTLAVITGSDHASAKLSAAVNRTLTDAIRGASRAKAGS